MAFILNHLKKLILLAVLLLVGYAAAGFWGLPFAAQKKLPAILSDAMGRQVEFEKITFNPFLFSAGLETLSIREKDGSAFVSVDRISARLSPASLIRLAPVITGLTLENPGIHLVRNPDGSFNFSDLAGQGQPSAENQGAEETGNIPAFVIQNVSVKNGKIWLDDRAASASHLVSGLSVSLPYLSSRPADAQTPADMAMEFSLNGARADIHVKALLFGPDPSVSSLVKTGDIDLVYYLSYLPLPDSLVLNALKASTDMEVVFQAREGGPSLQVQGKLNLTGLSLLEKGASGKAAAKPDAPEPGTPEPGTIDSARADAAGEAGDRQGPVSQGEIVGFERLSIDLLQSDLLNQQIQVGRLSLQNPRLTLERGPDGNLNLAALAARAPEAPGQSQAGETAETPEQPGGTETQASPAVKPDIKIYDAEITGGRISFTDRSLSSEFETRVSLTRLAVTDLAFSGDSLAARYQLALETEAGEAVRSEGSLGLGPFTAQGSLDLAGLALKKYRPYLRPAAVAPGEGTLSVKAGFDLKDRDPESRGLVPDGGNMTGQVKAGLVSLSNLTIPGGASSSPMIFLPGLTIKEALADLGEHRINLGTIETRDGRIRLVRNRDGQLDLVQALGGRSGQKSQTEKPADPGQGSAPSGPAWQVSLSGFDLAGYGLEFLDHSNTDPVEISCTDISVKAADLDLTGSGEGTLSAGLSLNKEGRISVKGKAWPGRKAASLDIGLDRLPITAVQPYFTDRVRVVVTGGQAHTHGHLDLDLAKAPDPVVRFKGKSSVTGFVCLDKENAKDFFRAKSFYLAELDINVFPLALAVKEISLTDFYSRIIVSETGELNLNSVFKAETPPEMAQLEDTANPDDNAGEPGATAAEGSDSEPVASADSPGKPAPRIRVDSVTLQGGDIQFSDFLTQPNFSAGMKSLAGSVTGLSSKEGTRADLHVKGLHGDSSPLEILGKINPLARTKYAQVNVSFRDIELTRFTPYAAKYLGYKIEKGKLVLDLEYLIDGNSLRSENRARFDNFFLGESVDSDDATSLPVGLAISLLKDRDGRISLDLPVKGELDDPEFKFGHIVLKMIGNLILKVATSPFALIGSMFEGGEDLETIEFAPGQIGLTPDHRAKVKTLAQVLMEKPTLKLEIQGMADADADAIHLRQQGFLDLVRAEKIKQLVSKGTDAETLKDVTVNPEEMDIYVYLAYAKADFPKPRDAQGMEKEVDVAEKKKLLMTHVPVSDHDLRQLALKRAEGVKAGILANAQDAKARIFLLEPKVGKAARDGESGGSRVQFILK